LLLLICLHLTDFRTYISLFKQQFSDQGAYN